MQFAEAVSYLLSLGHETLAIKLGLRNIELLLERLGHPERSYFSIQIAGTNGKGSTAAMLESICTAAKLNAGLFTSPHLSSITERIRIAGREISNGQFADCATVVRRAVEGLAAESLIAAVPTFFEQVTAIGLLAFDNAKVDLAILETGLGGRLDATTAVGARLVGITPIAMDHERHLGDTIRKIASEKAAIIRPGTSAVIAPQSEEVDKVILERAEKSRVVVNLHDWRCEVDHLSEVGRAHINLQTSKDSYENVPLGLLGRHQIVNAATAVRLAESLRNFGFGITHSAIVAGLQNVTHAGRLELFEGRPRVLLDGAHNPAGAAALRDYLDEFVTGPITLVFGAMEDKRLDEMAAVLFPAAKNLVLTRPANPRAASLEQLSIAAGKYFEPDRLRAVDSPVEAMQLARQLTPADGLICVAGSLYLVGEIREAEIEKRPSKNKV